MDAPEVSSFSRLVRARVRSLLSDSVGTTAAEFAMVVPVFIVLVFGTVNAGIAMSAVNQVHYAAERSARCLSVSVAGNCSKANIDTYAKGLYNGPGLTGLIFQSDVTDPACGKRVTGSGSYAILTGFDSFAINISATACYPII